MRTVADRDRWIALGLLLGVLVVAYFVLVHPWWTVPMLAENDRIHDLRERELRARMQPEAGAAGGARWPRRRPNRRTCPVPA